MPTPLALLYDPAVLGHQPPAGHPERPSRVQSVMEHLEASGLLEQVLRIPVVPATREQLEHVHSPSYLEFIRSVAMKGGGYLDGGDTAASSGSWTAATVAAGAAIGAVDAVMSGASDSAFAVVRPPGHHAFADQAMGFCLLNNAAIAAAHALTAYGLSRVLLMDFDVHHGNGTQEIFYRSNQALYFSTHQFPAYPGTGHWREQGEGAGAGYTVNVPLPADVGDTGFIGVFDTLLRPLADRFQPELVLVSAGYDAHWRNSAYVNGIRERVTIDGFAALSDRLLQIADRWCPGHLVGILEGGYDLDSLADGVAATLRSWTGLPQPPDPIGPPPGTLPAPDLIPLFESIRALHGL